MAFPQSFRELATVVILKERTRSTSVSLYVLQPHLGCLFRIVTPCTLPRIMWAVWFSQVCECLRRLLLTGLLVFLVPDTSGQVAYSCVFAFVRYILLTYPFMRGFPRTEYRGDRRCRLRCRWCKTCTIIASGSIFVHCISYRPAQENVFRFLLVWYIFCGVFIFAVLGIAERAWKCGNARSSAMAYTPSEMPNAHLDRQTVNDRCRFACLFALL